MNNKLAIVIELNGQMEKSARDSWKLLSELFSIRYISSRSPCPHIAIVSGFSGKHGSINTILKNLVKNITPFSITGNGLGVFVANTPVIHIRWNINKKLFSLKSTVTKALNNAFDEKLIKEKLNTPDYNWIAKTTLGFNDASYLNLPVVLNKLEQIDFKKELIVSGISLYEYSTEYGENKIGFFKFH